MNKLYSTLTFLLLFLTLTTRAELYAFSYTFDASTKDTQAHTLSGIVEGTLLDDGDTIVVTSLARASLAGTYYILSDNIGIRALDPSEQPKISLTGETLDIWVCTQGFSQFYEDGSGDCRLATERGFLLSDGGALDVIESRALANLPELGDSYHNSDIPISVANWKAQRVPQANTGLTVFADKVNADWPLWDCCAASTPTVEVDDEEHKNVAEFSILGAPETVQGFFSRNAGQPYDASTDPTFSFEMKVVTAPKDTGASWFLKIEADNNISNVNDFNLNTSKEGAEPVVGEWQKYTFDVATFIAAGIDVSSIDVIGIFPSWGLGSGTVYRIDNVQFGDGDRSGDELTNNGTFNNDTDGWIFDTNSAAVVIDNNDKAFMAEVPVASETSDVRLSQTLDVLPDASYILSFRAKASVERSLIAGFRVNQVPLSTRAETVYLSSEWQDFRFSLVTDNFGDESNNVFFDMAADVGNVYIDDVSVTLQRINFEPQPNTQPEPFPTPTPTPPVVDGQALTVFADDVNPGWPLWDCCSGSMPTVEVDDVEHGNVAEFSIVGSGETVQGFYSRNTGMQYDASADAIFSFEMKIVSAPTDANIPWLLKIEADNNSSDTGDLNLSTSKEGVNPVIGEWQTYTFDITALEAAGLNVSAIDVVIIFPTWGLGSGAVYRIDNVLFSAGATPATPDMEPTAQRRTMMAFDDVNADGVADWLDYRIQDSNINMNILSGDDVVSLASFDITHSLDVAHMHKLGDHSADGISEIGIYGFNSEVSRYQLVVLDGQTGQKMATFNWRDNLRDAELVMIGDITNDGVDDYAIHGIHRENGTRQLATKNGANLQTNNTFKWPNLWDNTKIVTLSDVTDDEIPEIALYGRHTRIGKGQLFVYDGSDATSKLKVYNWNKLWDDIQLFEMDDVDGEGTKDWGQFGKRKDGGRYQWIVKKGHDKVGVIRTFSWPADLENVIPILVADRTADGVRDVAITGTHKTTGRIYLRINDGKLANSRIANISWPAKWHKHQVRELSDLNNDGFNEYAMLGYLKSGGNVQLVVKDGKSLTEYGRFTMVGDWEALMLNSADVNADGVPDVMISGINKNTGAREYIYLNGTNLELLWHR